MHAKIGLQIQLSNGIYKIISLKIDRLTTDTSVQLTLPLVVMRLAASLTIAKFDPTEKFKIARKLKSGLLEDQLKPIVQLN